MTTRGNIWISTTNLDFPLGDDMLNYEFIDRCIGLLRIGDRWCSKCLFVDKIQLCLHHCKRMGEKECGGKQKILKGLGELTIFGTFS